MGPTNHVFLVGANFYMIGSIGILIVNRGLVEGHVLKRVRKNAMYGPFFDFFNFSLFGSKYEKM